MKLERLGGAVIVAAVGLAIVMLVTNVPTSVSEEDAGFIRAMMSEAGARVPRHAPVDFDAEVDVIFAVQDAVLTRAAVDEPLPVGVLREPRQLYEARHGWCFDRSRSIEKGLALLGFRVRHVFVLDTSKTGSALRSLATPGTRSHAVTEVRTSRGWVVVDSNRRWISLDSSGNPWSIAELAEAASAGLLPFEWSERNTAEMVDNFTVPFTFVFGLYSRHGQYFPPFMPFPDVNWRDLVVFNLTD